jgi:hypothetical protein
MTMNNHQLVPISSTAPSHLEGGNHQEKQEIRNHNDPQLPLDAIT